MSEAILLDKNKDKLGRFVKGSTPNPTGKNGYTLAKDIENALNSQAKRQGYKNFPKFVAQRALISDMVLVAVLKKICPDLVQGEGFADTTNVYNIIQQIQRDIQANRGSPLELDSGAGDSLHLGRTRQGSGNQAVSEQGISKVTV